MGLVGENGAGKSTMVKIISGFDNRLSSGDYFLNGKMVQFLQRAGREPNSAGIAIAQQELSLIPTMSVAENIFLAGDGVPAFANKRKGFLAKKARTVSRRSWPWSRTIRSDARRQPAFRRRATS